MARIEWLEQPYDIANPDQLGVGPTEVKPVDERGYPVEKSDTEKPKSEQHRRI